MRLTQTPLPLILSAVVLTAGCMAPQTTSMPMAAPKGGPVGFYDPAIGTGAISIRVIDNRRSTQGIADAADFNAVRFELHSASKLKSPRVAGIAKASGAYSAVFTDLPSDALAGYTLTAALYHGVSEPTSLSDAAYSNLDRKVGEGVSTPFPLAAGESKTITVVINAVGAFTFASTKAGFSDADPEFEQGDTSASVKMQLSSEANPLVSVRYYVRNMAGDLVGPSTHKPPNEWAASPLTTSLPFTLPTALGTYQLVVDMVRGSEVLSRRFRTFAVVEPSSVGTVTFGGSAAGFTINGVPSTILADGGSFSVPAVDPQGTLTFVNTSTETLTVMDGTFSVFELKPGDRFTYACWVDEGQIPLWVWLSN